MPRIGWSGTDILRSFRGSRQRAGADRESLLHCRAWADLVIWNTVFTVPLMVSPGELRCSPASVTALYFGWSD